MKKPRKLLFSTTLKDCTIQHFCTGGPGGSKQNKTASGSRIIHKESGAVGESREHRSQNQNTKEAFVRMAKSKKYQDWAKLKAAKMMGQKSTEDVVQEQMKDENIKTEVLKDNKWKEPNCNQCFDSGIVSGMGYFDDDKPCSKGCTINEQK